MKTQSAQCAQEVRAKLKSAFPGIKFSVTSDTFAGGNAVRVKWIDGPRTGEVDEIIKKFQYGHFNGMEDMYENSNKIEGITQVKFVTSDREMSEETKELLMNAHINRYDNLKHLKYDDLSEELDGYVYTYIWRKFCEISFLTVNLKEGIAA